MVKYYPAFGLTLYNDPTWSISLRHHSYQLRQPSGHFHSDANSITVSIGDIPLFVDPGTYVYTPSIPWRNYFRAMHNHNTFMLADIEPVPLTNNLWKLELPTANTLYKDFGVTPHRTFEVSGSVLAIVDQWRPRMPLPLLPPTTWNFTLAPAIAPRITESGVEFLFEKKLLATLNCPTISWSLTDGWYAPCYGQKVATKQLRGQQNTCVGTKTLLTLVAQ